MGSGDGFFALIRTNNEIKKPKIWIDIDNSPHVPFFTPIIKELEDRGYSIILTARDCFQVRDLVDLFKLRSVIIGRHYGKHRLAKISGTCFRALQLAFLVRGEEVCLAVSHGSRSQVMAASLLRIPTFCFWDYEYTKRSRWLQTNWAMIPAVIPDSAIPYNNCRVLKYHGIKEDVYVPGFRPDPNLRTQLGLNEDDFVVTARPPADEAHYHNPESDKLFRAAIDFLAVRHGAKVVLLPRNEKQERSARELWRELFLRRNLIIPEHAVDGLNLLWNSDLAISGGGTMNREAAALGVPVYSVFRGKTGAVDRYLAQTGRLVLLERPEDVYEKIVISKSARRRVAVENHSSTLAEVVDNLVAIIETGIPRQKKAA